jgi:hypothetical protein
LAWRDAVGVDRLRFVLQKCPHRIDEKIGPVVMHPMARILHQDDAGIPEMSRAAVLLRIGGPAFLAVDEQRRAGDLRP